MRILGIIGEPATGKSTLMRAVIRGLQGQGYEHKFLKLMRVTYWPDSKTVVLGVYPPGETFGGTDRLSMAVQADAEMFMYNITQHGGRGTDFTVMFEGDRLGNAKFLKFCKELPNVQCMFFALRAPLGELEKRHSSRVDFQSEVWLKGRRSKVNRLIEEFQMGVAQHADLGDTMRLASDILSGRIFEPEWQP